MLLILVLLLVGCCLGSQSVKQCNLLIQEAVNGILQNSIQTVVQVQDMQNRLITAEQSLPPDALSDEMKENLAKCRQALSFKADLLQGQRPEINEFKTLSDDVIRRTRALQNEIKAVDTKALASSQDLARLAEKLYLHAPLFKLVGEFKGELTLTRTRAEILIGTPAKSLVTKRIDLVPAGDQSTLAQLLRRIAGIHNRHQQITDRLGTDDLQRLHQYDQLSEQIGELQRDFKQFYTSDACDGKENVLVWAFHHFFYLENNIETLRRQCIDSFNFGQDAKRISREVAGIRAEVKQTISNPDYTVLNTALLNRIDVLLRECVELKRDQYPYRSVLDEDVPELFLSQRLLVLKAMPRAIQDHKSNPAMIEHLQEVYNLSINISNTIYSSSLDENQVREFKDQAASLIDSASVNGLDSDAIVQGWNKWLQQAGTVLQIFSARSSGFTQAEALRELERRLLRSIVFPEEYDDDHLLEENQAEVKREQRRNVVPINRPLPISIQETKNNAVLIRWAI